MMQPSSNAPHVHVPVLPIKTFFSRGGVSKVPAFSGRPVCASREGSVLRGGARAGKPSRRGERATCAVAGVWVVTLEYLECLRGVEYGFQDGRSVVQGLYSELVQLAYSMLLHRTGVCSGPAGTFSSRTLRDAHPALLNFIPSRFPREIQQEFRQARDWSFHGKGTPARDTRSKSTERVESLQASIRPIRCLACSACKWFHRAG